MTRDGPRVVLALRHGDGPADDRVHRHLCKAGYQTIRVRAFAGEEVPRLDGNVAGVVVFGGGFDAYAHENHSFLADEQRLIETAMARDVPVIGICQGAQQIAHALGAWVGPSRRGLAEFGYYRVDPVPGAEDFLPGPLVMAQSHWHECELPKGARWLASSAYCDVQAFSYGSALAVQFHPEVTKSGFRRWQAAPWARYGQPGAQTRDEQDRLMHAHDRRQGAWFRRVLERMLPPLS